MYASESLILAKNLDLQEEGIFRIPGSVGEVNEARKLFENGSSIFCLQPLLNVTGELPSWGVWKEKEATSVIVNFLNCATDSCFGSTEFKDIFATATGRLPQKPSKSDAEADGDLATITKTLLLLPLVKRETLRLIAG